MAKTSTPAEPINATWNAKQVYALASICLLLGLGIGYLLRGSQSQPTPPASVPRPVGEEANTQRMPTLEEMKHMADKQAEPVVRKLQSDPNNADLLVQAGKIYQATHQFQDAAAYFDKALTVDPKNVAVRSEMASCLYYSGDVDGAIAQLERSLTYDARNPNSLFNLGVIRWKGKKDAKGALTAWRQLLKSNPGLEASRKTQVQKLIAEVEQADQHEFNDR